MTQLYATLGRMVWHVIPVSWIMEIMETIRCSEQRNTTTQQHNEYSTNMDRETVPDFTTKYLNVDEMLKYVGEFGPYQWLLEGICFLVIFVQAFQQLIMCFAALNPSWKCVDNSSVCILNGTLPSDDNRRCHMTRNEWMYTEPLDYSIITQYDIYCHREWLIHLTTSVFFISWGIGAITLGWMADNYGRKPVFMSSFYAVIIVAFLSAFLPNIYLFLLSRLIVGFFIPGVNVQVFILITELVGCKYRAFAGQFVLIGSSISLCVLGLKAFFIRKWKMLFIICTVPYIFIIAFYRFIPESVHWLRLQGKLEKVLDILNVTARWNKKELPANFQISHRIEPM